MKKIEMQPLLHRFEARRRRQAVNRAKHIAFSIFRLIILLSIGYIILYPLLYMVVTSLRTTESYLDPGRIWIPPEISLEHFKVAYESMDFGSALKSTLLLEITSALIQVASCCVVAYGFARFEFKFKKLLTGILFLTILVPAPMIVIPLVVNFSKMDVLGVLGLFNALTGIDLRGNLMGTPLTFYLPSLFAIGLRSGILIYIYIQFFKGLPRELEEASWIDGAGPFKTFLRIAVPSSGVVILTVTVFSIIWHWNDYYLAVMYMQRDYPLAVSLSRLTEVLTTKGYYITTTMPETMGYLLAGCVLFVTPMLVLYLILQRWFIESIDRVGITG